MAVKRKALLRGEVGAPVFMPGHLRASPFHVHDLQRILGFALFSRLVRFGESESKRGSFQVSALHRNNRDFWQRKVESEQWTLVLSLGRPVDRTAHPRRLPMFQPPLLVLQCMQTALRARQTGHLGCRMVTAILL